MHWVKLWFLYYTADFYSCSVRKRDRQPGKIHRTNGEKKKTVLPASGAWLIKSESRTALPNPIVQLPWVSFPVLLLSINHDIRALTIRRALRIAATRRARKESLVCGHLCHEIAQHGKLKLHND
ncbi:hypothetical protein E2C01_066213 [Portunus trituberculatus]|uniref:Uncharacterized protein n=1 Tax=Portunus trituberculatus TaxID=210409 RepID=A0A5B7HGH5_PORTR|nr:hypothetical protein [Portunus trituberculatus]